MKQELDELLCRRYPKIFRDRYAPMTVTAMCWGFDCGDGWFTIIDALCANIQGHINHSRKERLHALRYNRALWWAVNGDIASLERYYTYSDSDRALEWAKKRAAEDLLKPVFRPVPEAADQVVAVQIKEKFGGLRFYVHGADSTIHNYITMAESMSYRMCEVCGAPGKVYRDGWHTTLCPVHAAENGRTDIENDGDSDGEDGDEV